MFFFVGTFERSGQIQHKCQRLENWVSLDCAVFLNGGTNITGFIAYAWVFGFGWIGYML